MRWVSALITGVLVGVGMALLPLVALADGPAGAGGVVQGRGVPVPHDMSMIVAVTALSLAALFVTLSAGYLYRRERHLDWPFQAADVPHDDHH